MTRLTNSRSGDTYQSFVMSLEDVTTDEQVLSVVYSQFQQWVSNNSQPFPVKADDAIVGIYGMADEDLDDIIESSIGLCGRHLPAAPEDSIIATVRDVVRFVAACPRGRMDGQ